MRGQVHEGGIHPALLQCRRGIPWSPILPGPGCSAPPADDQPAVPSLTASGTAAILQRQRPPPPTASGSGCRQGSWLHPGGGGTGGAASERVACVPTLEGQRFCKARQGGCVQAPQQACLGPTPPAHRAQAGQPSPPPALSLPAQPRPCPPGQPSVQYTSTKSGREPPTWMRSAVSTCSWTSSTSSAAAGAPAAPPLGASPLLLLLAMAALLPASLSPLLVLALLLGLLPTSPSTGSSRQVYSRHTCTCSRCVSGRCFSCLPGRHQAHRLPLGVTYRHSNGSAAPPGTGAAPTHHLWLDERHQRPPRRRIVKLEHHSAPAEGGEEGCTTVRLMGGWQRGRARRPCPASCSRTTPTCASTHAWPASPIEIPNCLQVRVPSRIVHLLPPASRTGSREAAEGCGRRRAGAAGRTRRYWRKCVRASLTLTHGCSSVGGPLNASGCASGARVEAAGMGAAGRRAAGRRPTCAGPPVAGGRAGESARACARTVRLHHGNEYDAYEQLQVVRGGGAAAIAPTCEPSLACCGRDGLFAHAGQPQRRATRVASCLEPNEHERAIGRVLQHHSAELLRRAGPCGLYHTPALSGTNCAGGMSAKPLCENVSARSRRWRAPAGNLLPPRPAAEQLAEPHPVGFTMPALGLSCNVSNHMHVDIKTLTQGSSAAHPGSPAAAAPPTSATACRCPRGCHWACCCCCCCCRCCRRPRCASSCCCCCNRPPAVDAPATPRSPSTGGQSAPGAVTAPPAPSQATVSSSSLQRTARVSRP